MKATLTTKYIVTSIIGLLFIATLLYARIQIKSTKPITPSPTPTASPAITPTVKGTTNKAPVVDSDPVVDCVSSAPNCNGESIRLRRSQCPNITCCGFNDGRWEVYPSTEKCKQAQQASQPTQQVQRPTTPTSQMNFYCYDNTLKYSYYTSSGEQCNRDNAVSACRGIAKSIYDMCMDDCLSKANQNSALCISAFGAFSTDPNKEALYEACIAEKDAEHQSCMDSCSKPYQESSAKCSGI